jgi:DNA-binding transcriptional regulator PaaX
MSADTRWETFILKAVTDLGGHSGDWAQITDLRNLLDDRGTSRTAQDRHLKRLSMDGLIVLSGNPAQMLLTAADHAAAVIVGGQPCHLVTVTRRSPR